MKPKIIASDQNWIEGIAVEQLSQTAELPGMQKAVGMPDLHPGKGTPIGAVFASKGLIYPHLVGNDIGCGMGLWKTSLNKSQIKLDKWTKKLGSFDEDYQTEDDKSHEDGLSPYSSSLGTIGGGNHFAELQQVLSMQDPDLFQSMNLSEDRLYLLVHSGSRGLGEHILQSHQRKFGNAALTEGSEEAENYLLQHDQAMTWATRNRQIIAGKFMTSIDTTGQRILDVCHNCVQQSTDSDGLWLHRKGAAPSDQGPIVIPGSRGALSYLVTATGSQTENLATLAHGAGRKWKRSDCRAKLENRFTRESLTRTTLGSRVICEDKALLYEEAPQAYKDIDIVVGDLVDAGLIAVIAILSPLITYKTGGKRQ